MAERNNDPLNPLVEFAILAVSEPELLLALGDLESALATVKAAEKRVQTLRRVAEQAAKKGKRG